MPTLFTCMYTWPIRHWNVATGNRAAIYIATHKSYESRDVDNSWKFKAGKISGCQQDFPSWKKKIQPLKICSRFDQMNLSIKFQGTKKLVSDSPALVGFAVVLPSTCPKGKWKFWGKFKQAGKLNFFVPWVFISVCDKY